jgi:hypothetical protein
MLPPLLLVLIVDPVFEVGAPAIYVEWRVVGAIHKKRWPNNRKGNRSVRTRPYTLYAR